jgi:hypothetical protein
VRLLWSGREVGRTLCAGGGRAPAWEDEVCEVPLPPLDVADAELRVQVWDRRRGGQEVLLGEAALRGAELFGLRAEPRPYPLRAGGAGAGGKGGPAAGKAAGALGLRWAVVDQVGGREGGRKGGRVSW